MKNKLLRQFISMALALAVIFSLSTAVFATGTPSNELGKITITGAVDGQTYSAYKLFDLTYGTSGDDTSYSYTYDQGTTEKPNPWNGFFITEGGKGTDYVTIDKNGYVTWKTTVDQNEATVVAFAKAALTYAKEHTDILPTATANADASGTVVMDALPLGYYLVDSSLGALCDLTSASPTASIEEKNGQPWPKKDVWNDNDPNDTGWKDWNDANIGDTVTFKTTITTKKGPENYVLYDKMAAGLTFGSISSVKKLVCIGSDDYGQALYGDESTATELALTTDYTVNSTPTETDNWTFKIEFTPACLSGLQPDDRILVEYTATLNENAVVGSSGNKNETWLTYGEIVDGVSKGISTTDTTWTYTWKFDVLKKNSQDDPLANAVFTLSKNSDGTSPISFVKTQDYGVTPDAETNAIVFDTYRSTKNAGEGEVTEITTDSHGYFCLEGLDAGTYYLTEVQAPDGYNRLSEPKTIIITSVNLTTGEGAAGITERLNLGAGPVASLVVPVVNESGSLLPTTGGMGTTIFYIIGAVLVLGTGVLLVVKKRMSAE